MKNSILHIVSQYIDTMTPDEMQTFYDGVVKRLEQRQIVGDYLIVSASTNTVTPSKSDTDRTLPENVIS